MNKSSIGEKIRVRNKRPSSRAPRPRVSLEPWAGFTRHDCPRDNPLPSCPSPHCRRAKACLAAHDNLYCQRTHFSPAEQKKWNSRDPYQRELDKVPPVIDPHDLTERMERINQLAAIQRAKAVEMTTRWKAGEFDQRYGPYRPKGVMLKPPIKIYLEAPEKGGA
jgi:hypothetical protein